MVASFSISGRFTTKFELFFVSTQKNAISSPAHLFAIRGKRKRKERNQAKNWLSCYVSNIVCKINKNLDKFERFLENLSF